MRARSKLSHVREIQILRDEKAFCRLCRLPDISVRLAAQSFDPHIFYVMAERPERLERGLREVLVQLDLHAAAGIHGAGLSSSPPAAAESHTPLQPSAATLLKYPPPSPADA